MPRGRRPGPTTTRDALIEVARRRFADAGYAGTSVRSIATEAGVDPALVLHFFGSKAGLFREVLGWPFDPARAAERLVGADGEHGRLGERLARLFLETWDDPTTAKALLAVLRGALTHEDSAQLLREFLAQQLFSQLAGLHEELPDMLRIQLAAAHLVGIAVLRYGLELEPIASAAIGQLVEAVAPALDRYLTAEGGR